jgi:hypothetical protein
MYFRHLILLDYWTQKDINIISKLFLNIFTNLKICHFIYWHTTIHYNYNNVRQTKILFKLDTPFWYLNCEWTPLLKYKLYDIHPWACDVK